MSALYSGAVWNEACLRFDDEITPQRLADVAANLRPQLLTVIVPSTLEHLIAERDHFRFMVAYHRRLVAAGDCPAWLLASNEVRLAGYERAVAEREALDADQRVRRVAA